LVRLNLFAGSSLASALIPQIAVLGSAADANTGFVSADYVEAGARSGIIKAGTSYLDTGVPATDMDTYGEIGVLLTTNWTAPAATECLIGMRNTTPTNQYLMIRAYVATTLSGFWTDAGSQSVNSSIWPIAAGSIVGLRGHGGDTAALTIDGTQGGSQGLLSDPVVSDTLYVFANNGPTLEYHMAVGQALGGYFLYKADDQLTGAGDTITAALYNMMKLWGEITGRRPTV
jgi:hypothetical protein